MPDAPLRLQELVEQNYLGRLPTDPFTGSNETWQEVKEDAPLSATQTSLGIIDVHSGRKTFPSKAPATAVGRLGFRPTPAVPSPCLLESYGRQA